MRTTEFRVVGRIVTDEAREREHSDFPKDGRDKYAEYGRMASVDSGEGEEVGLGATESRFVGLMVTDEARERERTTF